MGEPERSVLNMGEEKALSEEEASTRKDLREDKVSNDVSTQGFQRVCYHNTVVCDVSACFCLQD